jgi:ATP-dependent RNA helicase DHX29
VKETRYDPSKKMTGLDEVFISQASAQQRKGRAGRVQSGFCFRLYTEARFKTWRIYSLPEMLRVSLEEICLRILLQAGFVLEILL